jgi:hypothetical protein
MNIKDINSAIMFGDYTNEQLTSVFDAVKYAKARLQKQVKRSLALGELVQFTSSKTGRTLQGTVQKIAIKYITVKTAMGLWRVPANMLTVVEEEWTPDNADFNDPGSRHHY